MKKRSSLFAPLILLGLMLISWKPLFTFAQATPSTTPRSLTSDQKVSTPESWSELDRHRFYYYLHRLSMDYYGGYDEAFQVLRLYRGPEAREAIPTLIHIAQHREFGAQKKALELVTLYGSDHPAFTAYCQRKLEQYFTTKVYNRDDEVDYQFLLQHVLASGAEAVSFTALLFRWLNDEETQEYRSLVKQCIARQGQAALPRLVQMIQEGSIEQHILALEIIILMKGEARDAFPLLFRELLSPSRPRPNPFEDQEDYDRQLTLNATSLSVMAAHDPQIHQLLSLAYLESSGSGRSAIAWVLGQIPVMHPDFLPQAIQSIKDPRHHDFYRLQLLRLLKRFHDEKASEKQKDHIVSTYLELGSSEDNRLGLQALLHYASLTPETPAYFSLLQELAQHQDTHISSQALQTLSRYPHALVPLTTFLEEKAAFENGHQAMSIICLSRLPGKGQTYLPLVRQALHTDSHAMKEAALSAITHLGPSAAPLLEDLMRMLEHTENEQERRELLFSIVHMKQAAASVIPRLFDAFASRYYHDEQSNLAVITKTFAIMGETLIPHLIKSLDDPQTDKEAREFYLLTLGYMPEHVEIIAPYLIKSLHQMSWYESSDEFKALSALGVSALPYLLQYALANKVDSTFPAGISRHFHRYAQYSPQVALFFFEHKDPNLQKIGHNKLLFHAELREPHLLKILRGQHLTIRIRIGRKIGLTKEEEIHIPELIKILENEKTDRKSLNVIVQFLSPFYGKRQDVTALFNGLWRNYDDHTGEHGYHLILALNDYVSSADAEVFDLLKQYMGSSKPYLNAQVTHLIRKLRYHAVPFLPDLQAYIKKQGPSADPDLFECMALMGHPALPQLIEYLDSPILMHRIYALQAMREMEESAHEAVPHVMKLLHHRLPSIKTEALRTLEVIALDPSVYMSEVYSYLNHPDQRFQREVLSYFKDQRKLFPPAIPLMIEILNDPDERLVSRKYAYNYLGPHAHQNADIKNAIHSIAKDSEHPLQSWAQQRIITIEKNTKNP